MLLRLLNTGGTVILSSNGVSTVMLSMMVARKVSEVDVRNAEVMDTKERRQETWKGKVMGRNYLYTSQGVISWRFDGQFAVLGDAGGTGGARLNRQRASSILFGAIEGIRSNPETWYKPRGARCPHPFEASILGWNCSCRTTFGGGKVKLVPKDFSDVSNPTSRTNSFRKSH